MPSPRKRIQEQYLGIFADRTGTQAMRAEQIHLYFWLSAYVLLGAARHLGLHGTELARGQYSSIRVKLPKIGAQVHIIVRRVWTPFPSAAPASRHFAES